MTAPGRHSENDALAAHSLLERVTGIEPALSAWEAVPSGLVTWPDLRGGVSASDRERPLFTGVNGPLMARGSGSLISPSLGFHQRGLPETASNGHRYQPSLRRPGPGVRTSRSPLCQTPVRHVTCESFEAKQGETGRSRQ
jgi:hypothetical protein